MYYYTQQLLRRNLPWTFELNLGARKAGNCILGLQNFENFKGVANPQTPLEEGAYRPLVVTIHRLLYSNLLSTLFFFIETPGYCLTVQLTFFAITQAFSESCLIS